jgi:acyl-CoA dehydrogenase
MADDGAAIFALIDEVQGDADAARGALPDLAGEVWQAADRLREATASLLAQGLNARFAGAVPYLRATARVLGGHFHLRAALAEGGKGPRSALARVFIGRILPEHAALLEQLRAGDADLYALSAMELAS